MTTAASPKLSEDGSHYLLGQQKLTRVTDLLETVLRTKSSWWKPIHRLRGTFTHLVCEAIDEGDWSPALMEFPPDWEERDKQAVIQRGMAYQQFIADSGFSVLASELTVHSIGLGLCGTIDRIGMFSQGPYANLPAILDIKSGEPTAAAILQVALYEHLYVACGEMQRMGLPADAVTVRVILHVRADGKVRPEYRTGNEDILDGLSAVRIFNFMKRNSLL